VQVTFGWRLTCEVSLVNMCTLRLDALPAIIAEMVRPAEKIDSIRINQISGLGGAGQGGDGSGQGTAPVNQAFDAMLGAAMQLPVMTQLGKELGLNFENGLSGVLDDEAPKDAASAAKSATLAASSKPDKAAANGAEGQIPDEV